MTASGARIVFTATAAGALYGVAHDEVTAHLAPEYFTVAHPPLISSESPLWLGLFWGVVATVPLAALLGSILARIAHSPNLPAEPAKNLTKRIAVLVSAMAVSAVLAGAAIGYLASCYQWNLPTAWQAAVPPVRRVPFLAVWASHIASYFSGLLGFVILARRIWLRRNRPRIFTLFPTTAGAILRLAVFVIAAVAAVIWRWSH